MNWINFYTVEAYMPEGYYDIMCQFFDLNSEPAYVFVKDFLVDSDKDTTILSTSADRQVSLFGVDENNILLPDIQNCGGDLGVMIEFPESFKSPGTCTHFGGWPTEYVKFSAVRPDIKIYLGETAMIEQVQKHRYEISYPALMGITNDTSLANNPDDFRQYGIIYNPSPAVFDPYIVYGYGSMGNCLLGPLDYMLFSFGCDGSPSQPTDTIRLFSTNVAVDTNRYLFCYQLGHWEDNPFAPQGFDKKIYNWLYYLTPDDNLVLSASGKYPPVTGDYEVLEGTITHVGNNAPFNAGYANNSSSQYEIRVSSRFTDQTNARRSVDDVYGTYDIWNLNQHLFHDSIKNNLIFWYTAGTGIYSVVLHDSNYQLCGMPGYAQTTFTFEIGMADPDPPRLRAMQIRMGDSIATNIIHGYPSSVRFTAGDWTRDPVSYSRVYHHLKEARLYYKNFSEPVWQELIVQSQPANLDSVLGMPYVADLEEALNQYPDTAWIDLMIELVDSAGNSNTQTLHPAFLVRDAMTTIETVTGDQSVMIYPDPATDRIHIVTGEEAFWITILTSTGQPVMSAFNCREIDVSGLNPGLYIVRIQNTVNGRTSFGRFIR